MANKRKAKQVKRQIVVGYYKNNLVEFIQEELKVELRWWAKICLQLISKWGFKTND